MLLGRLFSYADSHRYRLGVNYQQIPVNAPVVPVHTYSKDGAMRVVTALRPGVRAELQGRPGADPERYAAAQLVHRGRGHADRVRDARRGRRLRPGGTLVRHVMDDAARDRLVANIVAHLLNGVTEPVLLRAFDYLPNVDQSLGDRVEKGVRQRPPA